MVATSSSVEHSSELIHEGPLATTNLISTNHRDDDDGTGDAIIHQTSGVESKGGEVIAALMGLVLFPLTIFSCYTVDVMTENLIFRWGRYVKTVKEPGVHWDNLWGREIISISTKKQACDLPSSTIVDANGSPLLISAVIVYSFVDTMRATLCVDQATHFIRTQAEAVLKQVVSRFPYECADPSMPCLKKEVEVIGEQLVEVLQGKVRVAGTKVHSFQLKEITYAPEIADGMLRRQQASALVEARHTIVRGAVSIAVDAVNLLEKDNIHMNEEEKTKLVTNLLTVICSESATQPTLPLGRG